MDINSISNKINFIKDNAVKKQSEQTSLGKEVKQEVPKDRIEISSEASRLKNVDPASNSVKNLDEIKQNIINKYYDSDQVIDKVADKILKEISG